ncbi:MAG: hypothetical protein JWQ63_2743 [Mucilaginibacter sp.]|jgi:hypothetical protein|nr:hypothetical protein [Mucilaginibacter sp.]
MARFKVNNIFTLTNHGQVLEGEVMDGEIAPGNLIRVLINENALSIKIKSVEYIEGKEKTEIRLLVGFLDKDVQDKLKIIVGRTISIV